MPTAGEQNTLFGKLNVGIQLIVLRYRLVYNSYEHCQRKGSYSWEFLQRVGIFAL